MDIFTGHLQDVRLMASVEWRKAWTRNQEAWSAVLMVSHCKRSLVARSLNSPTTEGRGYPLFSVPARTKWGWLKYTSVVKTLSVIYMQNIIKKDLTRHFPERDIQTFLEGFQVGKCWHSKFFFLFWRNNLIVRVVPLRCPFAVAQPETVMTADHYWNNSQLRDQWCSHGIISPN